MGLAMGVLIYLLARRFGLPAWAATLATVPVLFDAYELQLEADALPDIPSVSKFIPGFEASSWFGVAAPKATSPEIIELLNREINAGLVDPGVTARYGELGATTTPMTPAEFGAHIASETEKWAKVIKAAGIAPQ